MKRNYKNIRFSPIDLPILITSCINPVANFTALSDPVVRLKETLNAVELWLKIGVKNIVICDGSGYQFDEFRETGTANIEFISFFNDQKKTKSQGKGYGEGEIIKHAISSSNLIKKSGFFAKCTSKLFVENYWSLLNNFNGNFLADVQGLLQPKYLDTRFYISSVENFNLRFLNEYKNIDDNKGAYMEKVFYENVKNLPMRHWLSPISMNIVGLSGSTNKIQKRHYLKNKLRSLRNRVFRIIY